MEAITEFAFPDTGLDTLPVLGRALGVLQTLGSTAVGDAALWGFRDAADFAGDVEELSRRMAGRITVAPNRLKMRRQGDGWQRDLLQLLDEMAELYQSARAVAAGS